MVNVLLHLYYFITVLLLSYYNLLLHHFEVSVRYFSESKKFFFKNSVDNTKRHEISNVGADKMERRERYGKEGRNPFLH